MISHRNPPEKIRVMMIGPYPKSQDRLDGGVAAATVYLSQALAAESNIELLGVRIAKKREGLVQTAGFDWPVVDLPLGKMSLTTLYHRQKTGLRRLIDRHQPDVVHGQGTDIAGFLAVGCGLPAVVTVHGLLGECAKFQTDLATKARAMLTGMVTERRTVRNASDLIAITPYVTRYYGTDIRGRVHDIPNAISPAFFHVRRTPEHGRLLYAGRISNGKGLVELLEAAARRPASISAVVLAGGAPDPEYRNMLRRHSESLGLAKQVIFAGLLDEASLLDEFGRAEALVLPSYQETAPMVVQQAMAAGLAVVATRVGGIPDQIQHGKTGLLFDAGDVDGLAKLIERLGSEARLSRQLGDAAKAIAEACFQSVSVARATVEVYRRTLASHRGVRNEE